MIGLHGHGYHGHGDAVHGDAGRPQPVVSYVHMVGRLWCHVQHEGIRLEHVR